MSGPRADWYLAYIRELIDGELDDLCARLGVDPTADDDEPVEPVDVAAVTSTSTTTRDRINAEARRIVSRWQQRLTSGTTGEAPDRPLGWRCDAVQEAAAWAQSALEAATDAEAERLLGLARKAAGEAQEDTTVDSTKDNFAARWKAKQAAQKARQPGHLPGGWGVFK